MKASKKGIVGTFHPNEIFPRIFHGAPRVKLCGFWVKVGSQRLRLLKENPSCVVCGLKGELFQLEHNGNPFPHLNLYGFKGGSMVMLTRDHIVPVSKGGLNHLLNYQTMCEKCNSKKGDKPFEEFLATLVTTQERPVEGVGQ